MGRKIMTIPLQRWSDLDMRVFLGFLFPLFFVWPVFASVCVDCHEKEAGKPGESAKQFRGSIHSRKGISCHHCHGGDPTDSGKSKSPDKGYIGVPKKADIPGFCGKCHKAEMQSFLESVHGKTFDKAGPSCVDCHQSHAAKKASFEIINENFCGVCHPATSAAVIRAFLRETAEKFESIKLSNERFKSEGFQTEIIEIALSEARNLFRSLLHELDLTKLASGSEKINEACFSISERHNSFSTERSNRKTVGAIIVSVLLVLGMIFYLMGRKFE